MAHNPGVGEEAGDVFFAEFSDQVWIEPGERHPKGGPFPKDGQPGEAGLESLETQLLEQHVILGGGPAPLEVVVGDIFRAGRPPAALLPIDTDHEILHIPKLVADRDQNRA